jgi:hypothetical protein
MGRVLDCKLGIGPGPSHGGGRAVNHNNNNDTVTSGTNLGLQRRPRLAVAVIIAGQIKDNDNLGRIQEVDGARPPAKEEEEEEEDATLTLFPCFFLMTLLRAMMTLGHA